MSERLVGARLAPAMDEVRESSLTLSSLSHRATSSSARGARRVTRRPETKTRYCAGDGAGERGGWADYLRVRDERRAAAGSRTRAAPGHRSGRRRAGQADRPAVSKNTKRRIAVLERAVEDAEAALTLVEDELAGPARWTTPERSAESIARHEEAKRRVEQLYEELVALAARDDRGAIDAEAQ
jgi:hypothetical protein